MIISRKAKAVVASVIAMAALAAPVPVHAVRSVEYRTYHWDNMTCYMQYVNGVLHYYHCEGNDGTIYTGP